MNARILVVDDDEEMCRMVQDGLRTFGHEVTACTSADQAFDLVVAGGFEVVVTDLKMGKSSGIDLCKRIVDNRPDVPVIVMTGFGSLETAVDTIRAGAFDFLTKPLDADVVAISIERALAQRNLREEVKRLRQAVRESTRFEELLGSSGPMRKVYELIDRVAESAATTLVTGESGTGKELVARAIHRRSRREGGPFVAINCAAIPEQLIESELFGHVRGAFTDAKGNKQGLFLEASGGTLFLDEVGEMSMTMQAKLLRALEQRTVRPVGGTAEVEFDARLVAATNRDLDIAVEEGRFREDLLYRLNVVQIELPPLRARGNDVLVLAQHFLERIVARAEPGTTSAAVTGLSPAVAEKLLVYPWAGNVRELQNCIERAVALAAYENVMVEDLPEKVRSYKRSHVIVAAEDPAELISMEEVEKRYVLRVLEAAGGNKNQAARILGWDRKTLYRRLDHWASKQPPREPEPSS